MSRLSTTLISLLIVAAILVIASNSPQKPEVHQQTPVITPAATYVAPAGTEPGGAIKVGAFNVQVFGTTKADKPEVMDVLSKVIRNYDVIAIQEIRDSSLTALPRLVESVNSKGGSQYNYISSERLGTTASKEQYAYIFNTDSTQMVGSPYIYPDTTDSFQREPYVSEFKAKNGNFNFVLLTIHVDPDTATQEIGDMATVVDDAKSKYPGEKDFIILGDLNADCNYFDEAGESSLRGAGYLWLIDNSIDTTTKSTVCTYDRIIMTVNPIDSKPPEDFTGDSGVLRFDTMYNLSYDETIAVSDHYPVYATFWTNRDTD